MDGQSLLLFPVKKVKQNGLESFWLFGTRNQQVTSNVRDDHLIARDMQERTRVNRLKHNSGSRLAAVAAAAAAVSTIFWQLLFIISWALRFSLARWDSQREPGETLRAAGESPTGASRDSAPLTRAARAVQRAHRRIPPVFRPGWMEKGEAHM